MNTCLQTFPRFDTVGWDNQQMVERFLLSYPPYSDFNFASLWCYNVRGDHALANLNGNLVVRLRDYLTDDVIFTLLGREDIPASIDTLWDHSNQIGQPNALRLLPEDVYMQYNGSLTNQFVFFEDEANYDYILDLDMLDKMDAPWLAEKRRRIAKCRREHPNLEVRTLDLADAGTQNSILELCETWRAEKKRDKTEFATERFAIEHAMRDSGCFNFVTVCLFANEKLAGFNIYEPVHSGFCMAHFGKTDPQVPGANELLESETARVMRTHGCRWINFQQDLGLPGLRHYKRSWGACTFLKKYRVSSMQ